MFFLTGTAWQGRGGEDHPMPRGLVRMAWLLCACAAGRAVARTPGTVTDCHINNRKRTCAAAAAECWDEDGTANNQKWYCRCYGAAFPDEHTERGAPATPCQYCTDPAVKATCDAAGAACREDDTVGWQCVCGQLSGDRGPPLQACPVTPSPPTPPPTPAPPTPTPPTPVPPTAAPPTPTPPTPLPVPRTPAPATPAPATTAPATPAPNTPAPPAPTPPTLPAPEEDGVPGLAWAALGALVVTAAVGCGAAVFFYRKWRGAGEKAEAAEAGVRGEETETSEPRITLSLPPPGHPLGVPAAEAPSANGARPYSEYDPDNSAAPARRRGRTRRMGSTKRVRGMSSTLGRTDSDDEESLLGTLVLPSGDASARRVVGSAGPAACAAAAEKSGPIALAPDPLSPNRSCPSGVSRRLSGGHAAPRRAVEKVASSHR